MTARHSGRELMAWQAYYRLNNPEHREDLRAGKIAAAIINSQGGWHINGAKKGKAAVPADFFPWLKRAKSPTRGPENWRKWMGMLADLTLSSGGTVPQKIWDTVNDGLPD